MPEFYALSVRQPWADCIIYGGKNVENRSWRTFYRGPLLIHASKKMEPGAIRDFCRHPNKSYRDKRDLGGIIGIVDLDYCVRGYCSMWAKSGMWHWVLRRPRPLPFTPCPGRQGLFKIDMEIANAS